jgi:hypothetical protein
LLIFQQETPPLPRIAQGFLEQKGEDPSVHNYFFILFLGHDCNIPMVKVSHRARPDDRDE